VSTKLTEEAEKKLERVQQGSMGHLKGADRQRYEFNLLCWRLEYQHQNDGCWACTYVSGQRT
jgi:hypothetical protein